MPGKSGCNYPNEPDGEYFEKPQCQERDIITRVTINNMTHLFNKKLVPCTILILNISINGKSMQSQETRHVFYLHGMIVELQGINAVSETFGPYRYTEILDSLRSSGYEVHSGVRSRNTDYTAFAARISNNIDALIAEGTSPENITVIGASAGAHIAMAVSDQNTHAVNYVLLGANSDRLEASGSWKLNGRILGIYEASDQIAGKDYTYWINRSTGALTFRQLRINTGLGHGFLFRPIADWLEPVRLWVSGKVPGD